MSVRVQEFMERKGIKNQTELAERLGLKQSAISAWNSGTNAPKHDTCVALLKMGMTFRELFGDEFPDITFAQMKEMLNLSKKRTGASESVQSEPEKELDSKVEESVMRVLGKIFVKK